MNTPTTLALALIVVGIVLLMFGLNSADSIQSAFSRLFNGRPTDRAMWLIVGGCVCLVVGVVGGIRSRRT